MARKIFSGSITVVVGLIVWLLLPPFVDQVQQLIQQVPEYSTRIYNQAKGWLQLNPVIQEYFNAQSHDLLGAAGFASRRRCPVVIAFNPGRVRWIN